MVERRHKSRLPERVQDDLMGQFVAGATARTTADLVRGNRHTAKLYFHKPHELIALKFSETEPCFSGEIKVDESNFDCFRKGKREYDAASKVPVFRLLKRSGKVHVVIIPNAQQNTLIPIIRRTMDRTALSITNFCLESDQNERSITPVIAN
jgi:transposase